MQKIVCYNFVMDFRKGKVMLSTKNIVLKNGQTVSLDFYELPDGFSIYAIDKNNEIVGLLSFEILRKFVYVFSEEERQNEAKRYKLPLYMINEELHIDVPQVSQDKYDIRGDFLFDDGKKFSLRNSIAFLNLIEIKDKNFFQVGLGSAMHKEMEAFAREQRCDEIRLSLYYPFGDFKCGTHAFYEHVGYIFGKADDIFGVYKPLTRKIDRSTDITTPTVTNNSCVQAGTPINEKYIKEK